jgi:hypothetical protein
MGIHITKMIKLLFSVPSLKFVNPKGLSNQRLDVLKEELDCMAKKLVGEVSPPRNAFIRILSYFLVLYLISLLVYAVCTMILQLSIVVRIITLARNIGHNNFNKLQWK